MTADTSLRQRVIVVVPSLNGGAAGLEEALADAGFRIQVAGDFGSFRGDRPSALVVNISGFGAPERWADGLRRAINDREESALRGVPTLIVDPDTDWDRVGWAAGYDGRILWPAPAGRLRELLLRIVID